MKYVNLVLFISLAQVSYGQIFVNGTDLNKVEEGTYIQVHAEYPVGARLRVYIDYGQDTDGKRDKMSVEEGSKLKEFNSPVEALNLFTKNGWELVDTNVTLSQARIYTYLLRRKKQ